MQKNALASLEISVNAYEEEKEAMMEMVMTLQNCIP